MRGMGRGERRGQGQGEAFFEPVVWQKFAKKKTASRTIKDIIIASYFSLLSVRNKECFKVSIYLHGNIKKSASSAPGYDSGTYPDARCVGRVE